MVTFVDYEKSGQLMDILYDRDIRYLNFSSSNPTLHPKIKGSVEAVKPKIIQGKNN